MTHIDFSIFKDYDIRGVYPEEINEEVFYILGQAIAKYVGKGQIGIGYDMRLSSESLFSAMSSGVVSQGLDVIDFSMISTEMNYFASGKYGYGANVMISASHNPPEYNGVKIVKKGVVPLSGVKGLPEIKKLVKRGGFSKSFKKGKIIKKDLMPSFTDHVLKFAELDKKSDLKVVIDAGNGMGGISWKEIKDRLPYKIYPLYFEPDGKFPNHLPDPLKESNLRDLKKEIKRVKADLGFAIDGDADRLVVVDEKGAALSGTCVSAVLAEAVLKKHGGSYVLYNAVIGKAVPRLVKKLGGTPVRTRVGHSIIKQKMKEYNAVFGGEHSGHYYFKDNFYAESSIIAGLLFLDIVSKKKMKVSDLRKQYDLYARSGEINFKIENKEEILSKIEKLFPDSQTIDHIDGLSVFYPNWWFNLRASKTEPLLRLNIEADSGDILERNLKKVKHIIFSLGAKQA